VLEMKNPQRQRPSRAGRPRGEISQRLHRALPAGRAHVSELRLRRVRNGACFKCLNCGDSLGALEEPNAQRAGGFRFSGSFFYAAKHRTSMKAVKVPGFDIRCWALDVECWMLNSL